MANVIVKSNHLTYGGKQYFRGGAEDVPLDRTARSKRRSRSRTTLRCRGRSSLRSSRSQCDGVHHRLREL